MLVDLVNEQCIELARCVPVTLDANVMHSLSSMSIAMWSPHRETVRSLRCD